MGKSLGILQTNALCCTMKKASLVWSWAYRTGNGADPMDGCWFGQLRLIFSLLDRKGQKWECVLLKWLEDAPDDNLEGFLFQRMLWEKAAGPGQRSRKVRLCQRYDVQEMNRIIRPVFMQEHPTEHGVFFYNHCV